MTLRLSRRALSALAVALGLGLLAAPVAQAAEAKLPVVASFSILADLVGAVGGDRVAVTALVGPDGDVHVFNPSPADARIVAGAGLVVVNGLGLEGWIYRLIQAAGAKAPLVIASNGVERREMPDDDPLANAKASAPHMITDPHAWQSVANAKIYVSNILRGLIGADPAGRAIYEANAAAYLARLDALDAEVKAGFAAVPEAKRRVITTHDAFGYFGQAYGIRFIAPQGISTEAEATPKAVAQLIRQIRAEKITAVFIETMTDGRLIQSIAKETGVKLGGELYSDALSPVTGPAGTYIAMVRHNVQLLTAAMVGS